MTTFRPFAAIRYSAEPGENLSDVMAPPYDVLSDADRVDLEGRDRRNAVRLDFPPGKQRPSAYGDAAERLAAWLESGTLVRDADPTFTVLRMTATDETGRKSITTGVLGGLGLEPPGTGDVLPHEETTAKDKADRLNLIRATRINTSPIWGLSLGSGLGALLRDAIADQTPLFVADDEEGVRHEVWRIDNSAAIGALRASVEQAPVVIADGHHRFETGLAYLDERRISDGPEGVGEASAILALIVELANDQLDVRAIHRIITLPDPVDLSSALASHFDVVATEPVDARIAQRMVDAGALTLVTPLGTWLLRPKAGAFAADVTLDSVRLRVALAEATPTADVRYHHSVREVLQSVNGGRGDAGVLLRPATVDQIRDVANRRARMPAKTTFFWPKPRSGTVFRSVD